MLTVLNKVIGQSPWPGSFVQIKVGFVNSGFSIDEGMLRAKPMEVALYVVATPIGNLGDITLRALQTLAGVNLIACEDTRVSGKLLQRYQISKQLIAYHDHNATKQGPSIIRSLERGEAVALISDAGTPLISDPGFRLINDVLEAGFKVIPIPGASSPITALSASGLATDNFLFAGFLPPKKVARRKRLETLASVDTSLIFLESPKRLSACLIDCAEVFGDARIGVVAREMTKVYETFSRGSLRKLAQSFGEGDTPKGEIVLLIGPPGERQIDETAVDEQLTTLLKTHRLKDATEMLAGETGLSRRNLYQRALKIKDRQKDGEGWGR